MLASKSENISRVLQIYALLNFKLMVASDRQYLLSNQTLERSAMCLYQSQARWLPSFAPLAQEQERASRINPSRSSLLSLPVQSTSLIVTWCHHLHLCVWYQHLTLVLKTLCSRVIISLKHIWLFPGTHWQAAHLAASSFSSP